MKQISAVGPQTFLIKKKKYNENVHVYESIRQSGLNSQKGEGVPNTRRSWQMKEWGVRGGITSFTQKNKLIQLSSRLIRR